MSFFSGITDKIKDIYDDFEDTFKDTAKKIGKQLEPVAVGTGATLLDEIPVVGDVLGGLFSGVFTDAESAAASRAVQPVIINAQPTSQQARDLINTQLIAGIDNKFLIAGALAVGGIALIVILR